MTRNATASSQLVVFMGSGPRLRRDRNDAAVPYPSLKQRS
jgi:hypothetical protein